MFEAEGELYSRQLSVAHDPWSTVKLAITDLLAINSLTLSFPPVTPTVCCSKRQVDSKELEALEAKAISLRGGTLCEEDII